MSAKIDELLSKLHKLRKVGNDRWTACCPAHNDKSPSLNIRIVDDGRVLVRCMAGCGTESVLDAVGMTFSDLFPDNRLGNFKPVKPAVYPGDALRAIQYEARIVMIAGYDMLKGRDFSYNDLKRLELALERINTAVEAANVTA